MSKKKVSLKELENDFLKKADFVYLDFVEYVNNLVAEGKLTPIRGKNNTNGKNPPLYNKYKRNEDSLSEKEKKSLKDEIFYELSPIIQKGYFLENLDVYLKEKEEVFALDKFLKSKEGDVAVSEYERAFQIWSNEKFLNDNKLVLKHCGMEVSDLNVYETIEPLSYYANTRGIAKKILILENKDPFYGMRKVLLEGKKDILGVEIDLLVYGRGKGIVKSFGDYPISLGEYMDEDTEVYYIGDIDYEGIGIYESLASSYKIEIKPFVAGYLAMVDKGEGMKLNSPKEQNVVAGERFFGYFEEEDRKRIEKVLEGDRYIPQEILNVLDY